MKGKPYLHYEEQIEKLKSKHLVINDSNYAISILKKYGYYSLICGYKELFKNKTTNNYRDNVRFEEIVQLYEYDSNLREIFLKYLLLVEKRIKECLANAFCDRYTEIQSAYLDANNYDYSTARNRSDINKLISMLDSLSRSNKYPYIVHARKEHGNVPLWILFKTVTFGSISVMYKLQKPSLKSSIALEYKGLNEGSLGALLQLVSSCRNVCAHNERLYAFHTRESIPILLLHNKLGIPRIGAGNQCKYGQHDLFAVVISLRYLLSDTDFKEFKKQLAKAIDNYTIIISSLDSHITTEQIMECMGFPNNWKSITRYKYQGQKQ